MIAPEILAEYPELQEWWERIEAAHHAAITDYDRAVDIGGDLGLVAFLNASIRFFLAFGAANENLGLQFTQETVRSILISRWPVREIDHLEERILRVADAYARQLRLPHAGERDSRMQAAMAFAAHEEGLGSDDPSEAVRKSIQRFRKKVRGKWVCRLNRDTLEIELLDAESALIPGLPGKPGRPT